MDSVVTSISHYSLFHIILKFLPIKLPISDKMINSLLWRGFMEKEKQKFELNHRSKTHLKTRIDGYCASSTDCSDYSFKKLPKKLYENC